MRDETGIAPRSTLARPASGLRRIARTVALALLGTSTIATLGLSGLASAPAGAAAAHSSAQPRVISALTASVLGEVNTLRQQYGLSAAQLTNGYTSQVTQAAAANLDPALNVFGPGAVQEYGLWGISTAVAPSATPQVTSIVDDWVNDDGWLGAATANLDCTSPTAAGCNGHRRAVLSRPPQAGDTLSVDVATLPTTFDGAPAISVAMLMVWSSPAHSATAAVTSAAPKAVAAALRHRAVSRRSAAS